MIRVRLYSAEQVPEFILLHLKSSGEVEITDDSNSADVVLVFSRLWNHAALYEMQPFLNHESTSVVVVCEEFEEPMTTDSILRQHVSAVVQNHAGGEQLLGALRAAAAGLRVLPAVRKRRNGFNDVFGTLTPREMDILRLIADGEGNKMIAHILEISQHTVKFHIGSIFAKLHVSSRTEAVRAGISRGLISI